MMEKLIREYEEYHKAVWPEIKASIYNVGVLEMEIYRVGTRMFMIIEVNEEFSFEKWSESNKKNPKVAEWETLMSTFQETIPAAKPGEKWALMDRVFKLTEN